MAGGLSKILKQLSKEWKDTEPAELPTSISVPDGNYICVLEPARVELSKASDRLQIAWPIEISDGKHEGKSLTKFDGLVDEIQISYAKATMQTLGISIPAKSEKLPQVLEDFFEDDYKDRKVNVTVRTKDEFTNIFINGYFDDEGDEAGKDKNDGGDKDYEGPPVKKIKKMDKKALKKLIKEHGIDVDPDDYDDTDEFRDAVIEEVEDMID